MAPAPQSDSRPSLPSRSSSARTSRSSMAAATNVSARPRRRVLRRGRRRVHRRHRPVPAPARAHAPQLHRHHRRAHLAATSSWTARTSRPCAAGPALRASAASAWASSSRTPTCSTRSPRVREHRARAHRSRTRRRAGRRLAWRTSRARLGVVDVLDKFPLPDVRRPEAARGRRARHRDRPDARAGRRAHGRPRLQQSPAPCSRRSAGPERRRCRDHHDGHARSTFAAYATPAASCSSRTAPCSTRYVRGDASTREAFFNAHHGRRVTFLGGDGARCCAKTRARATSARPVRDYAGLLPHARRSASAVFYAFGSVTDQAAVIHDWTEGPAYGCGLSPALPAGLSVFVVVILGFLVVYADRFLIRRRKQRVRHLPAAAACDTRHVSVHRRSWRRVAWAWSRWRSGLASGRRRSRRS